MMAKKTALVIFFLLFSHIFLAQINNDKKEKQQAIIDTYLKQGAYQYHYLLQGWQTWIDKGLNQDSTIAYLWEMKALPYWKTQKYDLGISCYNKAVPFDRERNLGRRGYLRCVFQKNYKEAIIDMQAAGKEFGYGYQNDHSYQFYIALCYLQLNEFNMAEQILKKDFDKSIKDHGENWIHYLDLFYMGIIQYELKNYDTAINYFNKSITSYKQFSDAKYYKGLCLLEKGDRTSAIALMTEAKKDFENGYSINEDDSFYEPYPYKVNWYMAKWTIPDYKE